MWRRYDERLFFLSSQMQGELLCQSLLFRILLRLGRSPSALWSSMEGSPNLYQVVCMQLGLFHLRGVTWLPSNGRVQIACTPPTPGLLFEGSHMTPFEWKSPNCMHATWCDFWEPSIDDQAAQLWKNILSVTSVKSSSDPPWIAPFTGTSEQW